MTKQARPHGEEGLNGFASAFRAVLEVAADIGLGKFFHNPQVAGIEGVTAELCFEFTVLAVQQQIHLLWRVVGELFIVIEKAGGLIDLFSEHRYQYRAFIERPGHIQHFVSNWADLAPHALALWTPSGRIIERKHIRVADMRLANTGEQEPENGCNIGDGTHGRVRSSTQALLVYDHCHAQILERICVGLRITGHKAAEEHTEVFAQQSLRFVGNRIKDD